MYWILFIGIAVISYIAQYNVQRKFKKYSQMPMAGGMTGKDIAEKMLRDNHITDVRVISTPGMLTDHYNPATKTVNLSEGVYNSCSVAAAAVAAHECGHAVQHAESYAWLKMRSTLVPVVSFASNWITWILLIGILTIQTYPAVMLFGIILFASTTLFSFITLPVEINASNRALAWLQSTGLTTQQNDAAAKEALTSAAYTYVVAALSSLATLIYYVMIYMGRRD
ncbi:MAG: zinc metallopeptidase [Paludibacteraceae bacterium]|nr:zinc metallopeptidase [Paludibacteraceae bacterium]